MCDSTEMAREMVVTIFGNSAEMEGNEPAFLAALDVFEKRVRKDERENVALERQMEEDAGSW